MLFFFRLLSCMDVDVDVFAVQYQWRLDSLLWGRESTWCNSNVVYISSRQKSFIWNNTINLLMPSNKNNNVSVYICYAQFFSSLVSLSLFPYAHPISLSFSISFSLSPLCTHPWNCLIRPFVFLVVFWVINWIGLMSHFHVTTSCFIVSFLVLVFFFHARVCKTLYYVAYIESLGGRMPSNAFDISVPLIKNVAPKIKQMITVIHQGLEELSGINKYPFFSPICLPEN